MPVPELDHMPVYQHAPKGRRLRVFIRLVNSRIPKGMSVQEAMEQAEQARWICDRFNLIDLRTGGEGHQLLTEMPTDEQRLAWAGIRDPELHPGLQDLGYEINEDIHEACFAFDNPDMWYPGVDSGINPVSDDHVNLVMYALNRELKRERRQHPTNGNLMLPAVDLTQLPWNVQRALAERRRLRYLEFGVSREVWANGKWSLWSVPEDPEWEPRRSQRGISITT